MAPASSLSSTTRRRLAPGGVLPLIPCLGLACGNDDLTGEPVQLTWSSEAEYRFDDAPERNVSFLRPYVRADPWRNRVLVLDRASSQVSVWAPEGSLQFAVGRAGDGPGDLSSPQDLIVREDGSFSVLEDGGSRFTTFDAGGELLGSVRGVDAALSYQGFPVFLGWPRDGTHFGIARVPPSIEVGARGTPSFDRQPLLRVRRSSTGQWESPEPVLWLDLRNRTHAMRMPDGGIAYGNQPFGDPDRIMLAPGTALVVRTKGTPGAVELIEVTENGDTAWHQRLQFEPQVLTPRLVERRMQAILGMMTRGTSPGLEMSSRELRDIYQDGLYQPPYLPAVDGPPVPTASGEVWLKTHEEVSDSLIVYYVVRRTGVDEEPRRVLLPASLWITDATTTHVWGVWWDSMNRPHVVGRRLAP